MLGPVDLEDWDFDRRDVLSLRLRQDPRVEKIAAGIDSAGDGVPAGMRGAAIAFAHQTILPIDTLEDLAASLGLAS